jgi:hypothetical protein
LDVWGHKWHAKPSRELGCPGGDACEGWDAVPKILLSKTIDIFEPVNDEHFEKMVIAKLKPYLDKIVGLPKGGKRGMVIECFDDESQIQVIHRPSEMPLYRLRLKEMDPHIYE